MLYDLVYGLVSKNRQMLFNRYFVPFCCVTHDELDAFIGVKPYNNKQFNNYLTLWNFEAHVVKCSQDLDWAISPIHCVDFFIIF